MATALVEKGDDDVLGTAEFCKLMNTFFDCANVRSLTEHVRRRNDFIKQPYTSEDDERFAWLRDFFLHYLEKWRKRIMQQEGVYTADEKGKMFLSLQTYKGLKIHFHSHIQATHFLLEGFKYVLTERFMQDVLEDYFGHQRAKGGRADNPTAQQWV